MTVMPPPKKRAATWHWYLVPMLTLALFFVLRSCRAELGIPSAGPASAQSGAVTGL